MHSIVFIAAGLFFLFVAHYGRLTFDHFKANSTRTSGVIVAIEEVEQHGADNNTDYFQLPTVEYTVGTGPCFLFQGEIDVRQHGLSVGDTVSVLVSRENHRIAKLEKGSREKVILLRVLTTLGIASCAVGVYLFNPDDYRLEFLSNPIVLGAIALGGFFLYNRILPVIQLARAGKPTYSENAREISEDVT